MDWFAFAILAALFFSAQRIVAGFLLKKAGNPVAFAVWNDFLAGAIILPFAFFLGFSLPAHAETWVLVGLAVIFYGLGDIYTYKAMQNLSVSTWQIITQVRYVFALLGGFLIYSESITPLKLAGIALIILGAFATLCNGAGKKEKIYWSGGVFFTMLAAALIAFGILADKTIIEDFSMPLYVSLNLIAIAIGGALYMLFSGKSAELLKEIKIHGRWIPVAGGLFGAHKLLLIFAIKTGEVSRVVPVSQSALIFTVLAGVIFLKEYERLPQKITGIILMVGGILALYFL